MKTITQENTIEKKAEVKADVAFLTKIAILPIMTLIAGITQYFAEGTSADLIISPFVALVYLVASVRLVDGGFKKAMRKNGETLPVSILSIVMFFIVWAIFNFVIALYVGAAFMYLVSHLTVRIKKY